MNPAEEQRADAMAFVLARHLPYDYYIRSLEVNLTPSDRKVELDLVGVDLSTGTFACIEVKIGCGGTDNHDRRKKARKQLRPRVESGIFRRVYAAWDNPTTASSPTNLLAAGTIYVNATSPVSIRVAHIDAAPDLPLRESRERDAFKRLMRRFEECWHVHGSRRAVFLRCTKCRHWFYPFHEDGWNTYAEMNKDPEEHSPFCLDHPARPKGMLAANITTEAYSSDWEWTTSEFHRVGMGVIK